MGHSQHLLVEVVDLCRQCVHGLVRIFPGLPAANTKRLFKPYPLVVLVLPSAINTYPWHTITPLPSPLTHPRYSTCLECPRKSPGIADGGIPASSHTDIAHAHTRHPQCKHGCKGTPESTDP